MNYIDKISDEIQKYVDDITTAELVTRAKTARMVVNGQRLISTPVIFYILGMESNKTMCNMLASASSHHTFKWGVDKFGETDKKIRPKAQIYYTQNAYISMLNSLNFNIMPITQRLMRFVIDIYFAPCLDDYVITLELRMTKSVKSEIDLFSADGKEIYQPDYSDKELQEDDYKHPDYYNQGNIEVIDYIQDKKLNFCLGNVIKYISRAGFKRGESKLKDLKKARNYIDFEIAEAENEVEGAESNEA